MERIFSSLATPAPRRHGSVFARLLGLAEVSRSRHRLESLDDHILSDIGLTREEARREARKPFWDPPDHWLR